MPPDILDNINVVLVATSHPGNIGASARAMKTMGVKNLRLVTPKTFPCAEATALAAGADDILASARVYADLQSAIKDCGYILGSSARTRNISWPVISPERAAVQLLQEAGRGAKTAVIFGRESAGLSNEEIELCNSIIEIPTGPGFSSLNLAAAVQVICYELCKCSGIELAASGHQADDPPLADAGQMDMFYEHLQQFMMAIGYYDPARPRLLMRRLKRMFNRTQLDQNEYNILRGILAAAQKAADKK